MIALKERYKVTIDNYHFQLTTREDITVEALRENLSRLLDRHITRRVGEEGEVKQFLENHQKLIYIPPTPLRLASYLPLSLGNQYILRKGDFEQIDQILATHPYAVICGEPGFGKSTLAIEYGHRQESPSQNKSIVFMIAADSPEKIDGAYRTMAKQLGIRTKQENAETLRLLVHSQISTSQKKVLLIFDNVEQTDHILPFLAHLPQNIKALITTRHSRLIEGKSIFINVKPFRLQEARNYIYSSDIKDRVKEKEDEVEALITYYSKGTDTVTPYHLNRAVGIIKQEPIGGIPEYLASVTKYPYHEGEILLQQKYLSKSKIAWPMLQYAAYLDPDFINLSIFEEILSINKKDLSEAIKTLESLSAMHVVRREGQEGLSLHRLTQGIVKDFIANASYQSICLSRKEISLKLAESLSHLCPRIRNSPPLTWAQAKHLFPHIEFLLDQIEPIDSPFIARLWNKRGEYAAMVSGSFFKAYAYHQKGLAMWQRLYPNQANLEVASSLNSFGIAYLFLGGEANTKQGLKHLKQALDMRLSLYGESPHPEVASSLNNIGGAYERLGGAENRRKGLSFKEQALAMRQKLYGDKPHPEVADSFYHLGLSYLHLGGVENIERGLEFHKKALFIRQALYTNQPHPDVAASLSNICRAYKKLGGRENMEKGLEFMKQALEIKNQFYVNQPHPSIVKSLYHLGSLLIDLNRAEEGQRYLRQAKEMQQELNQKQL